MLKSISELSLVANEQVYTNIPLEGADCIYFLIVDRFDDGNERRIVPYDFSGTDSIPLNTLQSRMGGTLNGVRRHLAYIKELGCTSIWLSPVFENYPTTYHGYAICNFLAIDPRLGTLEDMKELVNEAHRMGLRIYLDIVLNHTADTWYYEVDRMLEYNGDTHVFGNWRDDIYPIPVELRDSTYYKKMGAIQEWDELPETREGDIFELKKLNTENTPKGRQVLQILIAIYQYWLKELDIDGYRIDTVKHLSPWAVANFCSAIHTYATYLGKKDFFIVGEAVGGYTLMQEYMKPIQIGGKTIEGLRSFLDFPLHFILKDVLEGKEPLRKLYEQYAEKQKIKATFKLSWNDFVVFADNHDQVAQQEKRRLANGLCEEQLIALLGFLYFMYGRPCLYYGTEQFFSGIGAHDSFVREPMFALNHPVSFHNKKTKLFKTISFFSQLRKQCLVFDEADMVIDDISLDEAIYCKANSQNKVVYWSKEIFYEKLILAFNPNKVHKINIKVKLTLASSVKKQYMENLYGYVNNPEIMQKDGINYIVFDLNPLQFVILK